MQRELELMVGVGVTPMQAIMAATSNAGVANRVADQIGTIAPGRFADLVILDANPLADVRNVERINQVTKSGTMLDRSYHATFADALAGDDPEGSA